MYDYDYEYRIFRLLHVVKDIYYLTMKLLMVSVLVLGKGIFMFFVRLRLRNFLSVALSELIIFNHTEGITIITTRTPKSL